MQIKDLIRQLKALYNTYTDEMKSVMGEPEIMIDIFRLAKDYPGYPPINPCRFLREYAGISGKIVINKSSDGVYDILSAFDEDQDTNQEAKESSSDSLPWPKIWRA